eukprot:3496040-Pleurochrysis_carterae.AAC.4
MKGTIKLAVMLHIMRATCVILVPFNGCNTRSLRLRSMLCASITSMQHECRNLSPVMAASSPSLRIPHLTYRTVSAQRTDMTLLATVSCAGESYNAINDACSVHMDMCEWIGAAIVFTLRSRSRGGRRHGVASSRT